MAKKFVWLIYFVIELGTFFSPESIKITVSTIDEFILTRERMVMLKWDATSQGWDGFSKLNQVRIFYQYSFITVNTTGRAQS